MADWKRVLVVKLLVDKPVAKAEAPLLFQDLSGPRPQLDAMERLMRRAPVARDKGAGRPTKKIAATSDRLGIRDRSGRARTNRPRPRWCSSPKRDDSLRRKHPWIFSGAIDQVHGQPGYGDTVEVRAAGRGKAPGDLSRSARPIRRPSQIKARMWTFADEAVDEAFFRGRLETALALRRGAPGGRRKAAAGWSTPSPTSCPGWWSTATRASW